MEKLFLGLDIGGTKINLRLENENGEMLHSKKTPAVKDFEKLYSCISDFLNEANTNKDSLSAMALGIPGCVSPNGNTVFMAPALGWENVSLEEMLFNKFKCVCTASNDVTMALIAECAKGYGKNKSDVFFLSIGTALGSAFCCGGNIINGFNGSAGEIGYFINEIEAENKKEYSSEEFGALEKKVSGTTLEAEALKINMGARDLFLSYDKNEKAKLIIDSFILKLSVAISNAVSLLNPEIVVLGGGVSESLPPFLDSIRETVSRLTPIKTQILITELKNDAGAIGACEAARQSFNKN